MTRLETQNLSVGFKTKQAARAVLSGLGISLAEGELLVLCGPNGGGKTTLLKTIAGFLPPLDGRILIGEADMASLHKREKAASISFVFQGQNALWPFSVEEFIAQGRFPHRGFFENEGKRDREAVAKAIGEAGLSGYEDRVVTELSGGEFQRVLIARAMAQETSIILMDEPTNNLDPKYQFTVMNLIRGLAGAGLSIMMSLHDLTLAKAYADRVTLVARGGLAAQGTPDEVLREDILKDVFEIPAGYEKFIVPRG